MSLSTVFIPSLEHIAIAKIAIAVCNNSHVKDLVQILGGPLCILSLDRWKMVVSRIISTIVSSKVLQEKIFDFIRPISLEIEQWKEDHSRILDTDIDLQNELHWKPEGTVDRRNTAKALIKNENIDIRYRFALASYYCFDGEIRTLWQKICTIPNTRISCRSRVVRLWIDCARNDTWGDFRTSDITRTIWLELVNRDDNAAALRYLLENLPSAIAIPYVLRFVRTNTKNFGTHVMRVCLAFAEQNQVPLDMVAPRRTLQCILNWPSPSLFMHVANQLWKFLAPKDFLLLLRFILYERVIPQWSDHNYLELLKKFWEDSPVHFKEYVMLCRFSGLLLKVINGELSLPVAAQTQPSSNYTSYGILHQGMNYKPNRKRCLDLVSGIYSADFKEVGDFFR